ncbi:septum formation initiator family protein [Prosthecochloris sp. N3]|uniref:Septum formation initiator family protein n=2 Tax=Chlorobiaceae TaxID=191412 RepID=A0ABR9XQM8_9CHLB|nr:septum formation initiator family protein [Prosthecochloris ethylica]MEC9486135.1 septum formation initiator family protein [Prosthecochloris sp.]RNA65768.1 septum formation initiator family protein [Prosthecochloris sp. ZM_2]MBF0586425.1 septum formation initiator family protein [Prosthecochloris ethylica]MBF0636357.1 septum formation initiator family protein [Prosthecochloris ethylica]NUK47531.1 septum formation initiator family protein [Prosthecochloris ethylica]
MRAFVSGIVSYVLDHPKKIFLLVVAGAFVLWIVFSDYGLVARLRMEAENRELKARYAQQEREIMQNRKEISRALEPESVEKTARENYNFRREGETLFIIRQQEK